MSNESTINLLALTTEIVTAHVENNHVATADLSNLIASVHGALSSLGGSTEQAPAAMEFSPATTIRKSLANPSHIISMIDGKPYSLLKRHLSTQGLTPAQYRARYSLPVDYPMTAPAYSEKRRTLAKAIGLGRKPGDKKPAAVVPASKPRGRASAK